MKLTHHTFKKRSSSRKRISVAAGLAIAKGNVVFTEKIVTMATQNQKKRARVKIGNIHSALPREKRCPGP